MPRSFRHCTGRACVRHRTCAYNTRPSTPDPCSMWCKSRQRTDHEASPFHPRLAICSVGCVAAALALTGRITDAGPATTMLCPGSRNRSCTSSEGRVVTGVVCHRTRTYSFAGGGTLLGMTKASHRAEADCSALVRTSDPRRARCVSDALRSGAAAMTAGPSHNGSRMAAFAQTACLHG